MADRIGEIFPHLAMGYADGFADLSAHRDDASLRRGSTQVAQLAIQ